MKRLAYALLGLVFVATVAVYFGWNLVMEQAVLTALKSRPKEINIGWKGLKVSGTQVTLASVEGWIPVRVKGSPFPLPFAFEAADLELDVPVGSVLAAAPRAEFSGRLYGGGVSGTVTEILGNAPVLAGELTGVSLASHPLLRGVGVQSGALSLKTPRSVLAPLPQLEASFEATVTQLNVAELPQQLTQIPIPAIKDGAISIKGGIKTGVFLAEDIAIQSNLLLAQGRFKAVVPDGNNRSTCEGDFLVTLSDEGYAAFGTAVRLAAAFTGAQIADGTRRFTVRLTGAPGRGNGVPPCAVLGPWCISAKFEPAS